MKTVKFRDRVSGSTGSIHAPVKLPQARLSEGYNGRGVVALGVRKHWEHTRPGQAAAGQAVRGL